uniref:Cytochrome b6-f complex subunit 6 n=1 Tax=Haematococcus lacustris TaxID=44745 RepID=A0A0S2ICT9_HAELA|nr:cytochrome B6-F complex subunit VI [Haematococcus lacustris]ALO21540.1 subunit VI of cytochrome b6/f complex [Haematococcus lacustris]AUW36451.1 cytochrome B6-F complex subunit VI [Haematococcus lacustris]
MITIASYIVLLFGAVGLTLTVYLGLVKIVKLI